MTTSLLRATAASHRDRDADAHELRDHLIVLWQYRVVIGVCALLGGIIAIAMGLSASRTYEAEAALQIIRPKTGEALALGEQIAQANYRPLIENRAVAARVIQETGLDKPPYQVAPSNFFSEIVEVEEVRNSAVFKIRGRLRDRVLVATVVNRVAELGAETARRLNQEEALQSRDDIKLQRDEAKARLEQATRALHEYRNASQIEIAKTDVNAALAQRSGLLGLLIGIEVEKARLAKAEQEMAKRNRVESVQRSIDSDLALMESARATDAKPRDVLGLQLKTELINPVYEGLDHQIATGRTKLAAMEREKAQLEARKLNSPQFAGLTDLYAKESEIARLEMERDLARNVYQNVSTSYVTTQLLVAGRSSALHVINRALAPDAPASRKIARNTLIGVLSGLLLAAVVILVYAAFTRVGPLPGEHP